MLILQTVKRIILWQNSYPAVQIAEAHKKNSTHALMHLKSVFQIETNNNQILRCSWRMLRSHINVQKCSCTWQTAVSPPKNGEKKQSCCLLNTHIITALKLLTRAKRLECSGMQIRLDLTFWTSVCQSGFPKTWFFRSFRELSLQSSNHALTWKSRWGCELTF